MENPTYTRQPSWFQCHNAFLLIQCNDSSHSDCVMEINCKTSGLAQWSHNFNPLNGGHFMLRAQTIMDWHPIAGIFASLTLRLGSGSSTTLTRIKWLLEMSEDKDTGG